MTRTAMADALLVLALAAAVLSQAVLALEGPDLDFDDDLTDEDDSVERGGRVGGPGGGPGAVPGAVPGAADGELLPPMHASSHDPLFLEEPQDTYVIKNAHATLRCSAINALTVYFKCSNAAKATSHQQEFVDPHDGVRHVEASVNVTRQDVEEFFGDKYTCTCLAWSSRGKIRSRPATVLYAYLKKQFTAAPYATRIALGEQAELRCLPPSGVPPPTVTWLRNGQPLATGGGGGGGGEAAAVSSVFVSGEGHLLVSRARLADQANYTCVAENIAARRVSEPAQLTVYVDGAWSEWGSWSDCSATCGPGVQRRTRTCTNPAPANGGKDCPGAPAQKADCVSECPVRPSGPNTVPQAKYDGVQLTEEAEGELHAALYVGLGVAFSVFSLVAVLLVRLLRRRGRRGRRAYTEASTEYPADFIPDTDKKGPDLTSSVPVGLGLGTVGPPLGSLAGSLGGRPLNGALNGLAGLNGLGSLGHGGGMGLGAPLSAPLSCYHYPLPLPRSDSEHHYDEPHLATPSASATSSSSSSCSTASASTSPSATSTRTMGSSRADSVNGGDSLSEAGVTMTTCSATSAGARLSLPECGVSLTVPEGALARGQEALISLAVLTEDRARPRLAEGQTLLSGVVQVGPPGLVLNKSAVLSVRHCAALSSDWRLSVWGSHDLSADGDQASWRELLAVGAETINTPAFVQLDATQMYLMWDTLSAVVLVGESAGGLSAGPLSPLTATQGAAKRIQVAVFAESRGNGVRVYALEDTSAALQSVIQAERRLGSRLAASPQTIAFRDGGGPLLLDLEQGGLHGVHEHQEIPFRHVWGSGTSQLHCAFSLQQQQQHGLPNPNGTLFRVRACQQHDPAGGVTIAALPGGRASPAPPVQCRTLTVTSTSARQTACSVDSEPFRLSRSLRQHLAQCLDPPNARGNDWRMLAQRLHVDRYINYFATKSSPTDVILTLWESRSREPTAMADLLSTLRLMGRSDAAQILEKEGGPSWV